jgi:hypothetical protein
LIGRRPCDAERNRTVADVDAATVWDANAIAQPDALSHEGTDLSIADIDD